MNPGNTLVSILTVAGIGYMAAIALAAKFPITPGTTRRSKLHRFLLKQTTAGEAKLLHADLVTLVLRLHELLQNTDSKYDTWSLAVEFFSRTSGWKTRCTKLSESIPQAKLPYLKWNLESVAKAFALCNGPEAVNRTPAGQPVTLDTIIVGGSQGISQLQASYWQQADQSDWRAQEAAEQLTGHMTAVLNNLAREVECLGKLASVRGPSLGPLPFGCDKTS